MVSKLEGAEIITYFINPQNILIFAVIQIAVCFVGMMYVIFCKKEEGQEARADDEDKAQMRKDIMLIMREEELELMNDQIDRKFNTTQNESGACFVGADPYDEVDWTKVDFKIEDEEEDLMDLTIKSSSKNKGKRWGIKKRLLKTHKSSQMGTIKEEQNITATENCSSIIALATLQNPTAASPTRSSSDRSSTSESTLSGKTIGIGDGEEDLIDLKMVKKAGKESMSNPVKQVNKEHLDNGQINAGFVNDESVY